MKLKEIILVIGVIVGLLFLNNVAQCATLTAEEKVYLCKDGDGPWDLKLSRDSNGQVYGIPPRVNAVDNDGHVYICDVLRDRILVFTAEGKPWKVIKNENLHRPHRIKMGENNTLFVNGVIKGKGKSIQFIVSYDGKSWIFRQLEKADIAIAGVKKYSQQYGQVLPYGKDGLRYLEGTGGEGVPLQLVDENNNYVKSVPSIFFDQKGRYYKPIIGHSVFGIYNESAELLGKFTAGGPQLLKFRGWVYVIEQLDEKRSVLRRYGENGSVEHEITMDCKMPAKPLISPNSQYIFLKTNLWPDGIWITRLTYHED